MFYLTSIQKIYWAYPFLSRQESFFYPILNMNVDVYGKERRTAHIQSAPTKNQQSLVLLILNVVKMYFFIVLPILVLHL